MQILRNHKGYTLVEVLVAIVLLGVAVIPLVSLIQGHLLANKEAGKRFMATMLTIDRIEEINKVLLAKPDPAPLMAETNNEVIVGSGVYRSTQQIEVDSYTPTHNGKGKKIGWLHKNSGKLVRYEVSTSWNGGTETVTMFTYYSKAD